MLALELLLTNRSELPSACLGNRPGDPEKPQQTSLEEAHSVGACDGASLFQLFSLWLGEGARRSSPVPAAAGAKQAFYEWGPGGGGEGLCYTSTLGNAFHSFPAIEPGFILKDSVHFGRFRLDCYSPLCNRW